MDWGGGSSPPEGPLGLFSEVAEMSIPLGQSYIFLSVWETNKGRKIFF